MADGLMATGTVRGKQDKGYGFIRPDDNSDDVFFLATSMVGGSEAWNRLQIGQRVEFETFEHAKGLRGSNVRPI